MTALRRIAFPLRLAWVRLARRGERVLLVAFGIAAGSALLAAVLAGSLVAQDRSVERATARVPAEDRTVRLVWGGIASGPGTDIAKLDRTSRRALAPLVQAPTRAMLFRTSQSNGHLFDLGAIDGLGRYVHVRAGRLPRPCHAERCEVLQLGGAGPVPPIPGLRLVRVGRATLDSPLPFGNLITRETYASVLSSALLYHTAPTPPLLLANGVDGLARIPVFVPTFRSYTWAAPLRPAAVHPWTIERFARRVTQIRSALQYRSLRFDLTAETAVVAVAGAAIGWAAGCGIGAFVAARAGAPAGAVLAHSVVAGRGFVLATAIAAAAALVVLLSLRAGTARLGALTVTPVDAAALGALVAVVIALARGAADTRALADERGTGAVLLVLPALIAFVAAVLWARVLTPALRTLERQGRNAPVPFRLAALSLARNPGRAAVAVAFLVVSLGLALFAETYRSTLARGETDQAAFAVPADYVVREDLTKLVPVFQAAALHRFQSLAPGVRAIPVLRLSGNVSRLEGSPGLTLLGLRAQDIPRLRWRGDYSPLSRDEIAQRLRPGRDVSLRGVRLPESARRLVLPVRAQGDELAVRAIVITPTGSAQGIRLGTTTSRRLAARVPANARGGLLVSLTFDLTNTGLHGVPNGGVNAAAVAQGTLRLGRPSVDGRVLPLDFAHWTATGGLTATGGGRIRYVVTGDAVARFRARQPTDDQPVPIVASQTLAAAAGPGGVLPVNVATGTIVGRVVGIVRRVPTVDEDVVIADGPTVATALNTTAPGSGTANELWLDAHLEAQGAAPATLRQHLRLRTALVAAFGLVGGIATGAVLAALVVALVTLTAGAGSAELPLLLGFDWPALLLGLLAYFLVAALLVSTATRQAFRADVAGRIAEVGT